MSTERTNFVISNETSRAITHAMIVFENYDYDGTNTPEALFQTVTRSTNIVGTIPLVCGTMPIDAGSKLSKPLELTVGIAADSKFLFTIVFEDGTLVEFTVFIKLAYQNNDPNIIDSWVVSPRDSSRTVSVTQSSTKSDYTNTYTLK